MTAGSSWRSASADASRSALGRMLPPIRLIRRGSNRHTRVRRTRILLVLLLACGAAAAKEDIEFVAEHLPEVAMDNRYATLPVWTRRRDANDGWTFAAQAGFGQAHHRKSAIDGPMLSVAASRALSSRWIAHRSGFADPQSLSGGDQRACRRCSSHRRRSSARWRARFEGSRREHASLRRGIRGSTASDSGWLGRHRWVGGVLFEESSCATTAGTSRSSRATRPAPGHIDFDNDYRHVTPFAGLELVRSAAIGLSHRTHCSPAAATARLWSATSDGRVRSCMATRPKSATASTSAIRP